MPKYLTPAAIVEAAASHGATTHGAPFPPSAIGRPHARPDRAPVTWDEEPQLGLFIRCRDCRDGFDRYFIEVEREQPTERLLALIAAHFAHEHPEVRFAPDLVWHATQRPNVRLATFMPMVAQRGPSIICARCPEGMNQIYLTPPPYGDARRLSWLLSQQPELHRHTRGYSSRQQADYLEALDRGLLRPDPGQATRALDRHRAQRKQDEPDPLDQALTTIMRQRVDAGELITHVIRDLEHLSLEQPTTLACQVGMQLPTNQLRQSQSDQQFAATVTEFLGAPPVCAQRHLWTLWKLSKSND